MYIMDQNDKDSQIVKVLDSKPGKKKVPKLPRRRKLTQKQANYVSLLLDDRTPTQAVIEAGYNVANLDYAQSMGCDLLRHPEVRSTLSERIREGRYDSRFESKWDAILNKDLEDKPQDFAVVANAQIKVMEQIARIGGLIAPKQVETRSLNLTAMLPERKLAK